MRAYRAPATRGARYPRTATALAAVDAAHLRPALDVTSVSLDGLSWTVMAVRVSTCKPHCN